jgi:hypothetical protein
VKKINVKRKRKMQTPQTSARHRAGTNVLGNKSYEMRGRSAPGQQELFVYVESGELVAYSCTSSDREYRADRLEFERDFFPEEEDRRFLQEPDGDWHF